MNQVVTSARLGATSAFSLSKYGCECASGCQLRRDSLKAAISAGIEERRVQLAEAQGQLVAEIFRRVFARLDLTPEQSARVPAVVSEELRRAAGQLALN